jgi:hypothetical protein
MIGYIPNEKQIYEGGYESEGSTKYFALPSKFSPTIEKKIKSKLKKII